ncbi:MAG: BlaI/MecI/CopY family transcriptional regulator [Marinifilaceae bacterium]|jgi:predicted transcriptional regulator
MKDLTKAEEQVMQYIWKLEKAFLKDIVEQFPEPKPAYTTISTVIRVLVKKKFIAYNTYGKIHEYFPLVSKDVYFKNHFKGVVKNFFSGSVSNFASFFTNDEDLNLTELEKMKQMIEKKINALKDKNE